MFLQLSLRICTLLCSESIVSGILVGVYICIYRQTYTYSHAGKVIKTNCKFQVKQNILAGIWKLIFIKYSGNTHVNRDFKNCSLLRTDRCYKLQKVSFENSISLLCRWNIIKHLLYNKEQWPLLAVLYCILLARQSRLLRSEQMVLVFLLFSVYQQSYVPGW